MFGFTSRILATCLVLFAGATQASSVDASLPLVRQQSLLFDRQLETSVGAVWRNSHSTWGMLPPGAQTSGATITRAGQVRGHPGMSGNVRLSRGGADAMRHADLSVKSSANTGSVDVGDTITYTIVASNRGPDAAQYAAVALVFDGLVEPAMFAPAGWHCAAPAQRGGMTTVTCTTSLFASAANARFTAQVRVGAAFPNGMLEMAAAIRAQTFDPDDGNNPSGLRVAVQGGASARQRSGVLAKSGSSLKPIISGVPSAPINPGDPIHLTISVPPGGEPGAHAVIAWVEVPPWKLDHLGDYQWTLETGTFPLQADPAFSPQPFITFVTNDILISDYYFSSNFPYEMPGIFALAGLASYPDDTPARFVIDLPTASWSQFHTDRLRVTVAHGFTSDAVPDLEWDLSAVEIELNTANDVSILRTTPSPQTASVGDAATHHFVWHQQGAMAPPGHNVVFTVDAEVDATIRVDYTTPVPVVTESAFVHFLGQPIYQCLPINVDPYDGKTEVRCGIFDGAFDVRLLPYPLPADDVGFRLSYVVDASMAGRPVNVTARADTRMPAIFPNGATSRPSWSTFDVDSRWDYGDYPDKIADPIFHWNTDPNTIEPEESFQYDANQANNTAVATTLVCAPSECPTGPSANLSMTAATSTPSITVGQSAQYTATASNAGPDAASAGVALVFDALVSPSISAPGGWTCNAATQNATSTTVTCTTASFANGASASFGASFSAGAALANRSVQMNAAIDSTTADPVAGNNAASASVAIGTVYVPAADLRIAAGTTTPSITVGDSAQYTATASNAGPDAVSAGVALVFDALVSPSISAPGGWTCNAPTQNATSTTVTCTTASFANGASASFGASFSAGAALANRSVQMVAAIDSTTADPVAGNNAANASVAIGAVYVPSADLRLTAGTTTPSITVGDSAQYTATASNAGPDAVSAGVALVFDALVSPSIAAPGGWTCNAPTQNATSTTVTCNTASFANGASASFGASFSAGATLANRSVQMVAAIDSTTADPAAGNNAANASVAIGAVYVPSADLRLTAGTTTPSITVGDSAQYTATASNAGPDAVSAGVALVFDALVSPSISAPGGWTCNAATQNATSTTVTCTTASFANGASASFGASFTAGAALANRSVQMGAAIDSTTADPVAGNNAAQAGVAIHGLADLQIVASAAPATIFVGQSAQYTATLDNAGPGAARYTAVALTLDALVVPTVAAPEFWTCTTPTQTAGRTTVTCSIDAFAAGGNASFSMAFVADASFGGSSVRMDVAADSQNQDPNAGNNGAYANVAIQPRADLSINVTAASNTVDVGQTASFTAIAANAGPSDAEATAVALVFDALVSPTVAAPSGWNCNAPTQASGNTTVTCTRATFANGASAQFIASFVADAALSERNVRLETAISSVTTDSASADNQAVASVTVQAVAGLAITASAAQSSIQGGQNAAFTVDATNLGPGTASGVQVTLVLDAPVTPNVTAPAGWTCAAPVQTPTSTSVACDTASLANAATAQFGLGFTAGAALSNRTVRLEASIASSAYDPAMVDNQASASVVVQAVSDQAVAWISGPIGKIRATTTETFGLRLINAGPQTAHNPTVTITGDAPAANVTVGAPAGWTCTVGGNTTHFQAQCRATSLTVGSSALFDVTVLAPLRQGRGNTDTLTLSAQTGSTSTDANAGNNSAVRTLTIIGKSAASNGP